VIGSCNDGFQLINFKAKCKQPPQFEVDVDIVGDFSNNVFTSIVNAKSTLALKFYAVVRKHPWAGLDISSLPTEQAVVKPIPY
jgi:hypothetical protein